MVKRIISHTSLFILMLCSLTSLGQRHLFSEISFDKTAVYVGEPMEVSVAVYTSTWFTKGVNPGNIKVNGAFTVYFRSLSTSKKIDGQTYAGVILYFHVFPYDDEDILFPSLEINIETPEVGGFKGIPTVVKTNPKNINVKTVPPGFSQSDWLVTKNMTVSDKWSANKNDIKVGDVLERTITRSVSGTVSELIPPIQWDSIPGISLYPSRSNVENHKSRTDISATRSDGIRYLFEKEGDIIIPARELTWWNPIQNRLYKRTLNSYTIHVQPNPDLGMLETVRSSLEASQQVEENVDLPINIFGLSLKQFLLLLFGALLLIFFLMKSGKFLWRKYTKRRQSYLHSDLYHFRLFLNSVSKKDSNRSLQLLYQWIDFLALKEPTLSYFASQYGNDDLQLEIANINVQINEKSQDIKLSKQNWKAARANFIRGKRRRSIINNNIRINP